jgi:ribosomal-protein-alanine N-acetyltransferase
MREMTPNDVDSMFSYYSNPEMMKYTSTDLHTSKDETFSRVTKLSASYVSNKGISWAIEEIGLRKVIGDLGIYFITSDGKKAGVGFNIAKEYWNKGYGTEALTIALRYVINEMGVIRIEGTCRTENTASSRVMEKAGMKYEGTLRQYSYKNGIYYDVKMYSLIKSDLAD